MSELNKNKYLDFGGLQKYDALIKNYIANGNDTLAAAIAALDAKIGTIEIEGSDDKTLADGITDIYGSIAEIVEQQGSLDDKDVELEGKINDIVGNLESLGESVNLMTLVEVANKLSSLDASVSKNTQDIVNVTERVSAVEEAIKNLGEIEGGESLGEIVSEVKLNTAAIATLKGEGEGSVKKAAADAQAAAEVTAAADATSKANAAESAAKTYADSLVKDAEGKSLFDAAGAADAAQAAAEATAAADATSKADAALAAAKEDAASLYQLKGDYEVAGTAAGLNAAMDERVLKLEAIDHEQLAADASAAAVAAIVAGAESDFDTLKEVEEWIGSHKEGAAELQTTVSNHTDSINTLTGDLDTLDKKVDADIQNLTDHMSAASTALEEVGGRLTDLEAFVEAHDSIELSEIEGLFA